MRNRTLIALAAAFAASPALADSAQLSALKRQDRTLSAAADTCVFMARTALVMQRAGGDYRESRRALEKCVSDGRDQVKAAHGEVKATFKKKPLPAELTEWRLEWMAVFDATDLKDGETEGAYMRKTVEARGKAERASNKFEIAVE